MYQCIGLIGLMDRDRLKPNGGCCDRRGMQGLLCALLLVIVVFMVVDEVIIFDALIPEIVVQLLDIVQHLEYNPVITDQVTLSWMALKK